ncbi:MAG TPA: hypothetical protein VF039_08340 [Longimicrobiales bacterium]
MRHAILALLLACTPAALAAQHGGSTSNGVAPSSRAAAIDAFVEGFVEYDVSYTEAARAEARRAIAALREEQLPSDAALALELARIAALAENGHSAVLPVGLAAPHAQLGVRFFLADDGLFVADAKEPYATLIGERVERVAGLTLAELRDVWSRYTPGPDGHRDESLPLFLETPALLEAAGLTRDSTRVALELAGGRSVEVEATGGWYGPEPDAVWHFLGGARAIALARAGRIGGTPLYLGEPDAYFRVVPLPDHDAVYLQFRANIDFTRRTDLAQLARAAIDTLRAHSPRFVIVDQRFNVGGDLNTTRALMQAIPGIVGEEGGVFAITSGRTFSAGIASVAYLKQAAGDRLTIVGAPVGDDLEFYAEGDLLVLPGDVLVTRATERHNYMTGCPEADCHGPIRANPIRIESLEPDVRPRFDYADVVAGRDPYMEEVLRRIEAARGTT